jgi:hypothetical protein
MKPSLLRGLVAVQLLALFLIAAPAWSQATSGSSAEVSCPASGSSAEVIIANTRRMSWLVVNTSGTDVRIGIISGAATTNLTTGNSILLNAGSSISDDQPGVFVGRMTCMSTTAAAKSVAVFWTYR